MTFLLNRAEPKVRAMRPAEMAAYNLDELVRCLDRDQDIPGFATEHHNRLRNAGFIPQRGGVMVPLDVFFARDLLTGTGTGTSKGGNLIGTEIGPLAPELGIVPSVIRSGATVLSFKQDATIPITATGVTAEWVDPENSAPTEGAPTFSAVSLTPKEVCGFVDYSRRLRLMSTPSVEGLTRQMLGRALARAIDTACLVGTGADGQPLGIVGTSGVNSVAGGTNGAALSRSILADMAGAIAADDALVEAAPITFHLNAATMKSSAKAETSAGSGRYLFEPDAADGSTGTLGGWRCFVNNGLPADGAKGSGTSLSTLVAGDFRQLVLGMFGPAEILMDPYTLSSTGARRLSAFLSVGVAVIRPEAFAVCTDLVNL